MEVRGGGKKSPFGKIGSRWLEGGNTLSNMMARLLMVTLSLYTFPP